MRHIPHPPKLVRHDDRRVEGVSEAMATRMLVDLEGLPESDLKATLILHTAELSELLQRKEKAILELGEQVAVQKEQLQKLVLLRDSFAIQESVACQHLEE